MKDGKNEETNQKSESTDQPLCCKTADIIIKPESKVSFGYGCIVHPKAKIIAEGGCNIIFGEYNIIEENVIIKATPKFDASLNNNVTITVFIGTYNHFKVGCHIENTSVESYNLFEYKCKLEDSYVENKCIITAGIQLPKRATVKNLSIIFDKQIRIENSNFNEPDFIKYIKELYKILAILLPKQNQMHDITV